MLRLPAVLRTHLFTAAATVVLSVYITYRQVEHGWLEVKLELKTKREREVEWYVEQMCKCRRTEKYFYVLLLAWVVVNKCMKSLL